MGFWGALKIFFHNPYLGISYREKSLGESHRIVLVLEGTVNGFPFLEKPCVDYLLYGPPSILEG